MLTFSPTEHASEILTKSCSYSTGVRTPDGSLLLNSMKTMGLRNRNPKANATDSRFIGRENILEDFAREWNKLISDGPRFIVNLHGLGGIGKTKLRQQFLLRHTNETMVCSLDANFDDLNEPLTVLKTIIRKTRKNGQPVNFEETQKLLARFEKLVNDAAKSSGDLPHALAQLAIKGAQIGGEFLGGTETGKLIRDIGEPAAELAEAGFDRMASLWRETKNEQDRKLLEAPIREITGQFVQELNRLNSNGEKFILTIDTYEKISNHMNQWLLKDLLGEPITSIDFDLRLLIAGREPLTEVNRHWHDEWGGELLEFSVDPFTLEETSRFLRQRRNITDFGVINKLYEITEGYPFWLDLWAISGVDPEHFFSSGHLQKIEGRLFVMFPDEKHQLWLRQAAIFRRFNQDLLNVVLEDEASAAFEWLVQQSSLVEGSENYWKIHDLARKVILTNLRNRSQILLTEPANKILQYFTQKLQNPWENWRELRLRLQLSEQDLQILSDVSYYQVLAHCEISNEQLDRLLRVSDSGLENVKDLFNSTSQACSDIELALDKNFAFARNVIETLSSEFDEGKLDLLKSDLLRHSFSSYQKAVLLNRIAKAFGFKSEQKKKALACFDEIFKSYDDYENALLAQAKLAASETPEAAIAAAEAVLKNNPDHEGAIFIAANCYDILNKYEEAIAQYKKAIEIDPKYVWAYGNWGLSLAKLDRYEEAIEQFKKAVEIDPNEVRAYNDWGWSLAKLDRHEEAIEQFKKAVEIDPKYVWAYNNWGWGLAKLDRHEEAIEQFKKAVEIDPKYVWIYGNWGRSLAKLDRHEEAVEQFKKAVEIDPKYVWAYNNWGWSLVKLDRYEEAIEQYKKAIEIDPKYVWAYNNWGWSLAKLDRHEEAIEQFKKAVEIDPKYVWAYGNWGQSLAKLDRYEEAIEQFKKAVEIDPKYTSVYYHWGLSLAKLDRHEEAIEQFKKAVEIDPKYVWAYNNWGWSLVKLDSYEEAIEQFKKAVEIDPKYTSVYYHWGLILAKLDRHEEAIEQFKKAVEIDPKYVWAYNNWGRSLAKLDRHEEAIEQFKKAIKIDPKYVWAYGNWGRSLAKLDCHEEAIEQYKKAIEIDPKYIWAYGNWGLSLAKLNRYNEAIRHFEKVFVIESLKNEAYLVWAMCLSKLNRNKEAIDLLNKAIEINADNAAVYYLRGLFYSRKGKLKRAIADYEKAIEIDSKDLGPLYNLAIAKVKLSSYDAPEYVEKVRSLRAEKKEKDEMRFYFLAGLAAIDGDSNVALKMLRKAVKIDFSGVKVIASLDIAFDSMRELPEFKAIFQRNFARQNG